MFKHLVSSRSPLRFNLEDYLRSVMVEEHSCGSCLTSVRVLRVSLVDELEERILSLLDALVEHELFTRDDREEVLCLPGPRARTRKVLDIVECKGEEAAKIFLSLRSQQKIPTQAGTRDQHQSVGTKSKTQMFK